MLELFDRRRWEELELQLDAALSEDATDARSAFWLANVLTFRSQYARAVRRYDDAWAQRWPGVVCLNNKGVALARAGEARAAVVTLGQALLESGKEHGPSAYNLAVLLDYLGEDGNRSGLIDELAHLLVDQLKLFARKDPPAIRVNKTFAAAASGGGWGDGRHPLEAPLFLWRQELRTGFGFELTGSEADTEEGYRYFEDGLAHLEAGRWQAAIDAFDVAEGHDKGLAARIVPHRNRAMVARAREHLREAREQRERGDFQAAHNTWETYRRIAAGMPQRPLVEDLVSEIRRFGERLRLHQPAADNLTDLQNLISMVRQRVDALARQEAEGADAAEPETDEEAAGPEDEPEAKAESTDDEAETSGSDETGPEDDAEPSAATAAHAVSFRESEYVRGLCRDAWEEQLRFLTAISSFEEAEYMLDLSEIQWFAQDDLGRWRRDVYTAKTEALVSQALGLQDDEAYGLLHEARQAAMEAGDPHLVDRVERQMAQRERRQVDLSEIEKLHGGGKFLEVLERCTDLLATAPDEPTLHSRRESALHRLHRKVRGSLRARQWDKALETAGAVLRVLPDDGVTRELADEARQGRLDMLLVRAENAHADRDVDAARGACAAVLEADPVNERALELRRRIEVAAIDDPDAAEDAYEKAFVELETAKAAGRPRAALAPLREMRRLALDRPSTVKATEWLTDSLVEAYRRDLELKRAPKKAEKLLDDLQPLLDLLPDHPSVLALRDELRREMVPYSHQRRERSSGLLAEVGGHLLAHEPAAALDVLEVVVELGEPTHKADVELYLGDALAQIRRRIERLDALEEAAPPGDGNSSAETENEKDELFRKLRRWDRGQAEVLRRELEQRRERSKPRDPVEEIRKALAGAPDPWSRYERMSREVLQRRNAGERFSAAEKQGLKKLWQDERNALGLVDRLRARFYERLLGVERFFAEEDEDDHRQA
jgi:hypothetical protein